MEDDQVVINQQKLKRFSTFKKDWNGYGADPIDETVIGFVKEIIEKSSYKSFEIFPLADGGIQLERDFSDNSSVEIRVFLNFIDVNFFENDPDKDKFFKIILTKHKFLDKIKYWLKFFPCNRFEDKTVFCENIAESVKIIDEWIASYESKIPC